MTTTATDDHDFTRNPAFVDTSNPSKLLPWVYLSGCAFAREHERLREMGITAVVNLTPDDFGCDEAGFTVLHIRIDDAEPFHAVHVQTFLDQMDAWEASGETVLIHCHAGISRTSSFAIAWLMHKQNANADTDLRTMWSECEKAVESARPIIMPHFKLKRVILDYFAAQDAPEVAMQKTHCAGCRNDFYNDKNPLGVRECWSFKTAKIIRRKAVHVDQCPPWNQAAALYPDCYEMDRHIFVRPEATR